MQFEFVISGLVLLGLLSAYAETPEQPPSGSVSGTVGDESGGPVSRAQVILRGDGERAEAAGRLVMSDADGHFFFSQVTAGTFHLTVMAPGFASQVSSGELRPGEVAEVPRTVLAVATLKTDVEVRLTRADVAEEQMKDEEKQRLLGFLPNYYVNYLPDAAPLIAKQKFELAWRTTLDPVSFGVSAAVAGIQQARNDFKGYGQGAEGYGKRFGASYADFFGATMISSAVLPSILRQDPRYFYKGTGSSGARIWYAIENAVIRKGDNGRWQPNYSDIGGNLAAGGISNLYYPSGDRNGLKLTFENAAIGLAADAAANLFEEFLSRRATPKLPAGGSRN